MHDDHRPQVVHLVLHVDEHLAHILYKLIQAMQPKNSGITQSDIDAMTKRLKAGNDSLESKLNQPD